MNKYHRKCKRFYLGMWPGVSGVGPMPPPWPPPFHLAGVADLGPAPPPSPPGSGRPTVGEQYSSYPAESNLKEDGVLVCNIYVFCLYAHDEGALMKDLTGV